YIPNSTKVSGKAEMDIQIVLSAGNYTATMVLFFPTGFAGMGSADPSISTFRIESMNHPALNPTYSVYSATAAPVTNNIRPTLISYDFGSLNVCLLGQTPCTVPATIQYVTTGNTTLGGASVLAAGSANPDFKLAGTNCTGTLPSFAQCAVDVVF